MNTMYTDSLNTVKANAISRILAYINASPSKQYCWIILNGVRYVVSKVNPHLEDSELYTFMDYDHKNKVEINRKPLEETFTLEELCSIADKLDTVCIKGYKVKLVRKNTELLETGKRTSIDVVGCMTLPTKEEAEAYEDFYVSWRGLNTKNSEYTFVKCIIPVYGNEIEREELRWDWIFQNYYQRGNVEATNEMYRRLYCK